jgi:hypothetical protein
MFKGFRKRHKILAKEVFKKHRYGSDHSSFENIQRSHSEKLGKYKR